MAPVADVSTDPEDYIYSRAFGQDAEQTSQYVQLVVTTMNSEKMGSVLKHFPGYGNNQDSHSGITTDERRYESFESTDFLPFIAGIKAGAKAILVAHNIVTAMDDEYPASLSAKVHQILRDELGFTGVIMTDDLKMEAIREQYGDEQSAVLAVLAGNDMIISTYYDVQIPAVIAAYENGQITKEQIDQSVLRILNWKLDLGIIE
ncbi:Beta-hexosaminidase [bioreactor metagenome]|uniref:Beta-hexosaminidase n=1 Tax=bioreactor metagenome TaxID=1076179 RepID=A0A645B7J0_9ZZZZ